METKAMTREDEKIGAWLSAALDDRKVCQEMKDDIKQWFCQFDSKVVCSGSLNGYYVEATPEALDKLVELGYECKDESLNSMPRYVVYDFNSFIGIGVSIESKKPFKQMWLHNNEFVFENPDPHSELRKEYEEALERGEIVKIEVLFSKTGEWKEWGFDFLNDFNEYRLKYYEIDFDKVPKGTKVEVSMNNKIFYNFLLVAKYKDKYIVDNYELIEAWPYCRLPKGTPIKDEWLKPVEKDQK